MITENISTLKINKLTKAQYERELAAGNINENELYLTPDEEITLASLGITATAAELNYLDGITSNVQTQLDNKSDSSHVHSAADITSGTLSSDRLPTVPISKGGTGAITEADARTNLGFTYGVVEPSAAPATGEGSVYFYEGVVTDDDTETSILPIEEGGTGATSRDQALINLLGYKPGYCKIVKKENTTNYSTAYNYFDPFVDSTETTSNMGEHIYRDSVTLDVFGDRTNYTVTGIRIGANVNSVRVAGSVRYLNNSSSSVGLNTRVYRYRDGEKAIIQTIVGAAGSDARHSHTINTITDVQEGDFIYFQSYKGVASRDIDVIVADYATQMTVQAIG